MRASRCGPRCQGSGGAPRRVWASRAPAADPRFDASSDTPEGRGAGPLLVVPLRFRGRTLGVCRIFTADPNAASPRTAEVLGAALSAAVRNVLLYRSLVDSIEEVARARKDSAEAQ